MIGNDDDDDRVPRGRRRVVVTDPDPTVAVKEALTLAIKNLSDKVSNQFDANDRAVSLARNELAAQLAAMIISIDGKFAANKDLVDQLAKANAVALTAALQTQKESAAKSEVAVGDMLKQLQSEFRIANSTTNEKIDRLTSRIDTGEGQSKGKGDLWGYFVGAAGLLALLFSLFYHNGANIH